MKRHAGFSKPVSASYQRKARRHFGAGRIGEHDKGLETKLSKIFNILTDNLHIVSRSFSYENHTLMAGIVKGIIKKDGLDR